MMRKAFVSIVAFVLAFATAFAAEPPRGKLNFLVLSDLGDFGGGDQLQVAETLGEFTESWTPTAILNLGDTFHYWGVESVDDPAWQQNFESIYTAPALHNMWYCVLGNHDYQGNTQAELDYTRRSRRWNLPARNYTKTFSRGDTSVEVIFYDSTPYLRRARTQPDVYPDAARQDTAATTAWLRDRLAASQADWTVVCAHHPLYSARDDASRQREDILTHIGPVLRHAAPDLYLAGDVHCFEHFAPAGQPTDFVTCSSGSNAYPVTALPEEKFASGASGFMTLAVDRDRLTLTMYDAEGRQIYEFSKTK